MEKEDKLAELEALLQITFNDRSLLQRAVTHHSCCPETAVRDSYDTLECLGDAILGAHVVEYIFRNCPYATEQPLATNPNGRLQILVLQRSNLFPRYRVLEQSAHNNDRVFTVGVFEN